jgi:hypothetical protein
MIPGQALRLKSTRGDVDGAMELHRLNIEPDRGRASIDVSDQRSFAGQAGFWSHGNRSVLNLTGDALDDNLAIPQTVSFVFWFQAATMTGFIFGLDSDTYTPGPGLWLYSSNNKVVWNTGDSDSNPFVDGKPSTGVWHHGAVVCDGTSGPKWYLDGVLAGTAAYRNPTSTGGAGTTFRLGESSGGGGFNFNGQLAEFSIHAAALTPEQIADVANNGVDVSDPAVLAYWPMSEGSGATVLDHSGFGNTLTASIGAVGWTTAEDPMASQMPQRFAGLAGYGTGSANWNSAWDPQIKRWAKENLGFWTDVNGYAVAADKDSFNPSGWI